MITKYVIDASVALKWVLPEVDTEKAVMLLEWYDKSENIEFIVPELFYSEVANGLWKRVRTHELSARDVKELYVNFRNKYALGLINTGAFIEDALDIAQQLQHRAIYDCIYLAVAVARKALFVTADMEFYRKAVSKGYQKNIINLSDLGQIHH